MSGAEGVGTPPAVEAHDDAVVSVLADELHDIFGGKIGYCHHETECVYPDGSVGPYKRCEKDAKRVLAALDRSAYRVVRRLADGY